MILLKDPSTKQAPKQHRRTVVPEQGEQGVGINLTMPCEVVERWWGRGHERVGFVPELFGRIEPKLMERRHMFGNLTLFLALASLSLAAFSLGSVWATAENDVRNLWTMRASWRSAPSNVNGGF